MLSGTNYLLYNSCCHYQLIHYLKSAEVGGLVHFVDFCVVSGIIMVACIG